MPDIQADGDSVTFTFDLVDPLDAHLVVRCDANGEVYMRIPERLRASHPFTADD